MLSVCVLFHHLGRAGREVTDTRAHCAGANLYDFLLLLLSRDALVVAMDRSKPEPERVTMDGGMAFWKGSARCFIGVHGVPAAQSRGAESAYDCGTIPCDAFEADPLISRLCSAARALYASYCMGCHSLQYSRHNRVARDLGIPEDLYKANLVFDPEIKLGS